MSDFWLKYCILFEAGYRYSLKKDISRDNYISNIKPNIYENTYPAITRQNRAGCSLLLTPSTSQIRKEPFRTEWTYINEVQFYCPSFLGIQFLKHFCGMREMMEKNEYRDQL